MFDLILEGGHVVDGRGRARYLADVAIRGDRIAAIGFLKDVMAKRRIDARGLFVCPGFIDIHTHSDLAVIIDPSVESKLLQGVTLEVGGNCGYSAAPLQGTATSSVLRELAEYGLRLQWTSLSGYLEEVASQGVAFNYATLVGHGTLRQCVMGFADRAATAAEMGEMSRLLTQALDEGAFGLSSGLIYPPGCFADTAELIALARVVARMDGFYATHMRNESDRLLVAVDEALQVSRASGVSLQVSHHKAAGYRNWGLVDESMRLLDEARANGLDVTCDVYPYTATATGLSVIVPRWAHEGGESELHRRLRDGRQRRLVADEIRQNRPGWEHLDFSHGWDTIMVADNRKRCETEGKTIAALARVAERDPVDVVLDLLLEAEGDVGCIFFSLSERDVDTVIAYGHSLIGSDSSARATFGAKAEGKPHPRGCGTFPRVLGRYVRERGALSWEEAVAKMTGMPARRLGLRDRGTLEVGAYADVTIIDPSRIEDKATFEEPRRRPVGVEYVIVNGSIAVERGVPTRALAGRVLRRNDS